MDSFKLFVIALAIQAILLAGCNQDSTTKDPVTGEVITVDSASLPVPEKFEGAMPSDKEEVLDSNYNPKTALNGVETNYEETIYGMYNADYLFGLKLGVLYDSAEFSGSGNLVPYKIRKNTAIIWFAPAGPDAANPDPVTVEIPYGNPEPYISAASNRMLAGIDFNSIPSETTISIRKWVQAEDSTSEVSQELAIGYSPVKLGITSSNSASCSSVKNRFSIQIRRDYGDISIDYQSPVDVVGTPDSMPVMVTRQKIAQEIICFMETDLDSDAVLKGLNASINVSTPEGSADAGYSDTMASSITSGSTTIWIVLKGASVSVQAVYSLEDLNNLVAEFMAQNKPVYSSAQVAMLDGSAAWVSYSGKARVRRTALVDIRMESAAVNHLGTSIYVSCVIRVDIPLKSQEQRDEVRAYLLANTQLFGNIYNASRSYTGSRGITDSAIMDTDTGFVISFINQQWGRFTIYSYSDLGEICKIYSDWSVTVVTKTFSLPRGQSYHRYNKLNVGYVF